MKGKNLLKKTVVLTVALAIAVGAAACGSKKDDLHHLILRTPMGI